jgi:ferric-dicitrate binding protein FerR (iron transport regulator)
MQNTQTWTAIARHLAAEESPEEEKKFLAWLKENRRHEVLFKSLKHTWEHLQPDGKQEAFYQKFTPGKIRGFVMNQALGNLIGFIVGLSVTHLFSHHVMERRSVHNLFGIAGRKEVVVNDMPAWIQWSLSVIVGFIALEFVNHLIQNQKHLIVWDYFKGLRKTS